MTAANPYGYGPQNDSERQANDEAVRRAVAYVVASYANETAGRRLSRQQQQQADKAARLARWLSRQATGGGRR